MKMNKKRAFSDEFKTEAVRRVVEDGRSVPSVAKELGVARQHVAGWLKRARELGEGPVDPLSEDEREELRRLVRSMRGPESVEKCTLNAGLTWMRSSGSRLQARL